MSDNSQITHCFEQVVKFSEMLEGKQTPDRSVPVLYAQLGFNLGRFVELQNVNGKNVDGKFVWQLYEKCIALNNFQNLVILIKSLLI